MAQDTADGPVREVRFVSPGEAALATRERLPLPAGRVRVQTRFSLVSTGTELAYLDGSHHDVAEGRCTFPMGAKGGYSNVGVIVETAPDVTGWRAGQRVFSMTGHASEALPTPGLMTPVPDSVSDGQAAFAAVGSIALHGVRMGDVRLGHTVLVTGLGLIGQLAVRIARLAGAARVLATDPSAPRLDMALDAGAVPLDTDPGAAVQVAIECSGHPAAIRDCIRLVADEGVVVLLGCPHRPVELDLYTDFQKRQLRLVGAYQPKCPAAPSAAYPWSQSINRAQVLAWLGEGALDVDS
ncbi:MAG: zinc-binding alcohol dehydrogenase, partial [Candidatus Hydrogenedentes bacterium]|nr:zinc-binding alcohol dehydrogenase [Candidatus Hydrogenedentota bacterium]